MRAAAHLLAPLLLAAAPRAQEGAALAFEARWLPTVEGQELERDPGRALSAVSADMDGDGRLDVLVGGVGPRHGMRLYLRREGGFEDVTQAVGLGPVTDVWNTLLLDADDDSDLDVLLAGGRLVHRDFGPRAGNPSTRGAVFTAATVTDVEGDGRRDVFLYRHPDRLVALNLGVTGNTFLRVDLRAGTGAPVGTLVRAHYADGRALVQRHGSADTSSMSQACAPLHFGVAAGNALTALSVLWPGATEWVDVPVPAERLGGTLVLER